MSYDNDNSIYLTEEDFITDDTSSAIVLNDDASKDKTLDIPNRLPVLPVRDVVLFNYSILPLFIGRDASVEAVEAALATTKHLYIVTQKDEHVDVPTPDDLYTVGTVVTILRMLKLPDGRLKLLVQGISRARTLAITKDTPYLEAEILTLPEAENVNKSVELEALMRVAREQSEHILSLRGMVSPDAVSVLASIDHPGRLADLIAANLRINVPEAQGLLECIEPVERLRKVTQLLAKEAEVVAMQTQIQESAREGMDKAQREYFLREQLKAIRKELGDTGSALDEDDDEELVKALKEAGLPEAVQKEADKQMKRLMSMHAESSEAGVIRNYLELLSELPWKKLTPDRLDIKKAVKILDEDHYGLEKIKDRILEFLAVRKLNKNIKSPILCFVGPPGVGKTSLGRSIARAMGRKFERLSLGGMRDEAEIRGHRRTYVGAMPGRIIQSVKQAGTRNPLIMLDEIDKLGADFRGDPSSALLEVLDPEQNCNFSDHYLNVPFDLSKTMFICTANSLSPIPRPLLDRMEIIELTGYTMREKLEIAKRYLVPRQIKENGLKKADLSLSDEVIEDVIQDYTRESGVRTLERTLGALCRKTARKKAEGDKGPFTISQEALKEYLGQPKYDDEAIEKDLVPGVAIGLAWTPYGGEVLHIETSVMEGKGALQLTGQLGDVMKESAQAAVSYARSHASELGIDPQFNKEQDIHIHVPAGATPKDGPSAGVTLATALISALSGKAVSSEVCMTGEITLRGMVMPVGGIKEKILAAVSNGLTHAVIPQRNMRDLEEVPAELLERITIHPAKTLEDVLAVAFKASKAGSTKAQKATTKKNAAPKKNVAAAKKRTTATKSPDKATKSISKTTARA